MDLISCYFNYKINCLVKYANILIDDDSTLVSSYFKVYATTFINTYYYKVFDTLNINDDSKVGKKEIVDELKGKQLELKYENKLNDKLTEIEKQENDKIIDKCYYYIVLAINIDLLFVDFKNIQFEVYKLIKKHDVRKVISNKSKENLIKAIKTNLKKRESFFNKTDIERFYLEYSNYFEQENKYLVDIKWNIKSLDNTYKYISLEKAFASNEIYKVKLEQTLFLLSKMILIKLLNKEELGYYFVNLNINYLNKDEIDYLFSLNNNVISKKHIVFIIDINDYVGNKVALRNNQDYAFALLCGFKNIKDVSSKLEMIDEDSNFKYLIVNDYRSEDKSVIFGYEMENKFIFENRLDINEEGEE